MERWERLNDEYGLYVTKEHGFSTDTILLADFSMPKKSEACADFGTGAGAIAFLWKIRANPNMIYGIEIQESAVNQARKSLLRNRFDKIEFIHGDVRKNMLPNGSIDLIACNPPYKAKEDGVKSVSEERRIARHEERLTIEELTKAAAYALKFGGSFCLCQRPERLVDVIAALKSYKIEPKRLRFVQQRKSTKPSLFLLEGKKGGKSGLIVEPAFIIENESGGFSDEMKAAYGDYYLRERDERD